MKWIPGTVIDQHSQFLYDAELGTVQRRVKIVLCVQDQTNWIEKDKISTEEDRQLPQSSERIRQKKVPSRSKNSNSKIMFKFLCFLKIPIAIQHIGPNTQKC